MTDLKPENTLYDVDLRKGTLIDLGGIVKLSSQKDVSNFEVKKFSIQKTALYTSPELSNSKSEVIDLNRSLAYSCGKVL
jgi:serine/threonine protein kinase